MTLVTLGGMSFVAQASTAHVVYDQSSGTLSVTGNCSSRFVLVVIRRASDGSIWGSSNPDCEKGTYSYSITVPPSDRTGGTFIVDTVDGGTVPANANTALSSGATAATVTFSEPVLAPDTTSITIDTSSLAAAPPDDGTFLDNILQGIFGIVTSVVNTVKATVVAAMQIFAKTFTVLPGGSIVVPKGVNQVAGEGWLAAGMNDVFIPDALVASSSEIIVTPTSPTDLPLSVTQKIDGQGFHVSTLRPPSVPISFAWLVIGTYASGPATVSEQSVLVGQGSGSAPVNNDVQNASSANTAIDSGSDGASSSTDASTTIFTTSTDLGVGTSTVSSTDETTGSDASSTSVATTTDATTTTDTTTTSTAPTVADTTIDASSTANVATGTTP